MEEIGTDGWKSVRDRFGMNSKLAMWTHPLVPSGMMMWARVELLKETPRSVEQLMRMCMDELNPAVQSAFPAAAIR